VRAACMALAGVAGAAEAARADVLYDEGMQGDLSGDRFAPTRFELAPGSWQLFGIMAGEDPNGNIDRDYFTVVVPTGHVLRAVFLDGYFSPDFAAFMAIQPGAIFPNDPETVMPDDLMGWTHFGPSHIGSDLLLLMGANGQGFIPPLPAGSYTFWGQQQADYTEYVARFEVEAVPGPAGVVVLAGLALGCRRRRQ
jgi:hypothetical protein